MVNKELVYKSREAAQPIKQHCPRLLPYCSHGQDSNPRCVHCGEPHHIEQVQPYQICSFAGHLKDERRQYLRSVVNNVSDPSNYLIEVHLAPRLGSFVLW